MAQESKELVVTISALLSDGEQANDNARIPRVGETVERAGMRVRRFSGTTRVTDLAHAGRRGKTVTEIVVSDWSEDGARDAAWLACKATSFADFESRLRETKFESKVSIDRQELKSFGVQPAGFVAIRAKGANGKWALTADWDSVTASDLSDPFNEPRAYVNGLAKAAKVRKWLESHQARLENCRGMHDATHLITSETQVHFSSYCANN